MRSPRIGVTTYQEDASWRGWHQRASLVPRDYLQPLADSGALPVLLPPDGGEAEAADLAQWLDGLLLTGGPDVEPTRYGRPWEPATFGVQPERDGWELALLSAALHAGLPVLAVCRGMQLLNVARGGTLRQEIADRSHQPAGRQFGRVAVELAAGQLPGALLGTVTTASCYHHQAIDELGDGLTATGRSADGMIESIQLADREFVVGVQWHPEALADGRLFQALVHAAGRCPH